MRSLPASIVLVLVLLSPMATKAQCFFDIDFVEQDFLETAPWIFQTSTVIPISVEDCWDIITDDDALPFWFPELTDVENEDEPGVNNKRTVVFDDCVLNLLSFGAVGLEEVFDVWEDTGDVRRYQFYYSGATRPNFYSWKGAREKFACQKISDNESFFHRTAAFEPDCISDTLEFVVRNRLERIFEELTQSVF